MIGGRETYISVSTARSAGLQLYRLPSKHEVAVRIIRQRRWVGIALNIFLFEFDEK